MVAAVGSGIYSPMVLAVNDDKSIMLNQILNISYEELLPKIDSSSIDVVITDPPYGIGYQNTYTKSKRHAVLSGDGEEFSYKTLAEQSYRVLRDNTAIFCFTSWSQYPKHFIELSESGFSMKEPLIGQKRPSSAADIHGTFQCNSDWCMFGHKGKFVFQPTKLLKNSRGGVVPSAGRKPVSEYKTRFPSCWFGDEFPYSSECPRTKMKHEWDHPTVKGLEFIKWIILLTTKEGDTILDPFMGSGTTAVAAKMLNRNFIGCDISSDFVELGKRRLSELDSIFEY